MSLGLLYTINMLLRLFHSPTALMTLCSLQLDNAHGGGAALTVDGCTRGVFATCGQKTDFKVFRSVAGLSTGRRRASLLTA